MPKKNGQPTKAELRHNEIQTKLLVDEFIIDNKELLNWGLINKKFKVSDNVIINCHKYIKWPILCRYQKVSLNILKQFHKKIHPYTILTNKQPIDDELLEIIESSLDDRLWNLLTVNYKLPFELIDKYKDKLHLEYLNIDHLNYNEKAIVQSWIMLNKLSN